MRVSFVLPTMPPPSFQSSGIIATNPAIVFPKHLAFFLEQNRKKSGAIRVVNLQVISVGVVVHLQSGSILGILNPLYVSQMGMPPPGAGQTILFSATFLDEIRRLGSDFLKNHVFLSVGKAGSSTNLIVQRVEFVRDMDKRVHLMKLLCSKKMQIN